MPPMDRHTAAFTPLTEAEAVALAYKAVNFHPMEMIPGFGSRRRGPFRDLYLTLLWNSLLAISFTGIAWLMSGRLPSVDVLWANFLIANCAGFTIHALFMIGSIAQFDLKLYQRSRTGFGLYTAGIATVGVVLGVMVAAIALELDFATRFASARWMGVLGLSSVLISLILMSIFFWRARSADAEAALAHERQRSERVEREAAFATLRALQAQIEPHFLFNTLANVVSLVDLDPPKAKRMLESFIRFLRATLGATRGESTTLASEKELLGAFLDVLQIRMGARLAYRIELDPATEAHTLPPMLLQPIVENAIRHGLEPKVEGGELRISSRLESTDLVIEISDTGVGFAPTTTGGLGLTNVRDRLRLLYGERAALAIRENGPAGTTVTLRVPA